MALTGSYRINFTDPKKGSFVIEPYTANGTVTATSETLHNKATSADTSLLLYGQYVPNYGEQVHENMVRLLENFSSEAPPTNPIEGQMWHDVGTSYNIVGLSSTAAILEGNQTAAFGQFATNGTVLTVWYGPLTVVDNTYASMDIKIATASVNQDGTTSVIVTNVEGAALNLPSTTVGGFITVKQQSGLGRLRVFVKGPDADLSGKIEADEMVWADVVNFVCAPTHPANSQASNGDPWYDTATNTLKVFLDGEWISTTRDYLPLAGGVMGGTINMESHPILFTGAVSTGSTLTPKTYVDATIASAVADVTAGSNAVIDDITIRLEVVEAALPDKLSRDGGNIRNALVFGDDDATSSVLKGIDMKNQPITNPLVTWNAADYLTAGADPHYVVDKEYVALALSQHLTDEVHNPKGYLLEQLDGTGLIPGDIHFDDDYELSWNRNSTIYGQYVRENAFVITTGSNLEDIIELRHGSQPTQLTDPSFAIGGTFNKSYQTLYLFDGQPQPIAGGGITDPNDDTAAASKGFVRTEVIAGTSGLLPVINATYATNTDANSYVLTLERSGADPVDVDMFHAHQANTITYTYQELGAWAGGSEDLVKIALEATGIDLMAVPMSSMLTELNKEKAPIRGAHFLDLPIVGSEYDVIDVDVDLNRFEIMEVPDTLEEGMTVNLTTFDGILNYTAIEVVTEVDSTNPEDPWTSYWLVVEEPVPADFDPVINQWTITYGWRTEKSEGRMLTTRTTLDYELRTVNQSLALKAPLSQYIETPADADFTEMDNGQFIDVTSATAVTLTIPVDLPPNWSVEVFQGGAGRVTIAGAAGVTLRSPNGAKTKAQYSVIKIRKLGDTETYVIYQDTAA